MSNFTLIFSYTNKIFLWSLHLWKYSGFLLINPLVLESLEPIFHFRPFLIVCPRTPICVVYLCNNTMERWLCSLCMRPCHPQFICLQVTILFTDKGLPDATIFLLKKAFAYIISYVATKAYNVLPSIAAPKPSVDSATLPLVCPTYPFKSSFRVLSPYYYLPKSSQNHLFNIFM